MRLLALLLAIVVVPSASACWKYVAPEILIDQADLVVVGTVIRLEKGDKPNGQYAIVKIDKVLLDMRPPADGMPPRTTVKIFQIAVAKMSAALRYDVGAKGGWALKRMAGSDAYRIGHPSAVMRDGAKMQELVAARKALKGGAIVGGLQLRAELLPYKSKTTAGFWLRLSVKNTTDKPITVPLPLTVQWTLPTGKAKTEARLGQASVMKVVVIPAGGVRHLGRRVANKLASGTYQARATATSNVGGAALWSGTLVAPTLSHTVK